MKLSNVAISKLEYNIVKFILEGNETSLRWTLESLQELQLKVMWGLSKAQQQTVAVVPDNWEFAKDNLAWEDGIYLADDNNKIMGVGSVLLGFAIAGRMDRLSVRAIQW